MFAVLRALPVVVTLILGATAWAQPAGTSGKASPQAATQSAVLPSIEILSQQTALAASCGGATSFNLNTYIRVDTQASAAVQVSAPGFPNLETFTDETGTNIGPYNSEYPTFMIPAFGGGLPPNTPIRIVVNTYTGKALAGTVSYTSTIQFDCTTGAVLNLVSAAPGDPPNAIPTLGLPALGAMTLLLIAAAFVALRRRSAHSAPGRAARRQR